MRPELIAVGASLGGLDALRTLLGGLPADFPCPLVLVQHRRSESDGGKDGALLELLSARSALPVVEPDDKEPIVAGHVYLAASSYHLVVERGFFSLSLDVPVLFARPSIDVLFESMADSYGAAGIAVMLTGSNDDGASGALAVKNVGGTVLVQDPATARAPEAPRAVLARCTVDAILPIERIAEHLVRLCR
jgi:two-component system, chemotaxis family, protein-glutamate methylesterase/glutaminase